MVAAAAASFHSFFCVLGYKGLVAVVKLHNHKKEDYFNQT